MINPIHKIRDFYDATITELKKCTWPSWRELWESTAVVIISAILLAGFVFVVDVVIQQVVRFMTA